MTKPSDTVLPPWYAEAEALKMRVLDRLERMAPDERRHTPGPGEWSAAQVTAHLILSEERLVDDWHAAALAAPALRPSPKGALIAGMAGFAMRHLPVRVPTIPTVDPNEREPDGDFEPRVLAARWATVRERLVVTLPSDAARLWIIHPIFGPLSCRRFGTFLVAHLHHHLRHWPDKSTLK